MLFAAQYQAAQAEMSSYSGGFVGLFINGFVGFVGFGFAGFVGFHRHRFMSKGLPALLPSIKLPKLRCQDLLDQMEIDLLDLDLLDLHLLDLLDSIEMDLRRKGCRLCCLAQQAAQAEMSRCSSRFVG